MGWLRLVLGVGIAWLVSIVIVVACLELAHRAVLATERDETAEPTAQKASAVSVRDQQDPIRSPTRF